MIATFGNHAKRQHGHWAAASNWQPNKTEVTRNLGSLGVNSHSAECREGIKFCAFTDNNEQLIDVFDFLLHCQKWILKLLVAYVD